MQRSIKKKKRFEKIKSIQITALFWFTQFLFVCTWEGGMCIYMCRYAYLCMWFGDQKSIQTSSSTAPNPDFWDRVSQYTWSSLSHLDCINKEFQQQFYFCPSIKCGVRKPQPFYIYSKNLNHVLLKQLLYQLKRLLTLFLAAFHCCCCYLKPMVSCSIAWPYYMSDANPTHPSKYWDYRSEPTYPEKYWFFFFETGFLKILNAQISNMKLSYNLPE